MGTQTTNAEEQLSDSLPIACNLPERERFVRSQEVSANIFAASDRAEELMDGYAFRFPGNDVWANSLLQFVVSERACCPFFTFELIFEPNGGTIWLKLRGPEGVKAFVQSMVADSRLV